MRQEATVVILPTDKKVEQGSICLHSKFGLGIHYSSECSYDGSIRQHLYITTDDKIKEGDWCLFFWDGMKDGELGQIGSEPQRYFPENGHTLNRNLRKIIATTDESLNLAKPSQAFIKKYCEQGGIDKVLVEYQERLEFESAEDYTYGCGIEPKLTPNNELIISMVGLTAEDIIEQMGWNYENTESSARRVAEFCAKNMNWIKENL